MTTEILQQAIESIKAGDKQTGGELLKQVIRTEPEGKNAEMAWLWMARVVRDPKQKAFCLKNVLKMNPGNQTAIQALDILKKRVEKTREKASVSSAGTTAKRTQPSAPTPTQSQSFSPSQHSGTVVETKEEPITVNLTAVELPQLLGVLGGLLLILGVFTPLITIPIIGQVNFFANGRGNGVFLLPLAVTVIVLVVLRQYKWVWIPSFAALAIVSHASFYALQFMAEINTLSQETAAEEGLFSGLAAAIIESVQLQWGWGLLLVGVVLVLLVPLLQSSSRKAPLPIGVGIGVSVLLIVALITFDRSFSSMTQAEVNENLQTQEDAEPKVTVPVGEPIEYQGNTLQILQVHDPTGFLITDSIAFDHKPVSQVANTHFVTIEFQFTCSETGQTVCDTVPEASLELVLEDGRKIDDDWGIYDADRLGEEEVASGGTVTGWRAFRVPNNGVITALETDPFEGEAMRANLPAAENGIQKIQTWQEIESGYEIKLEPKLRRDLLDVGISSGYIMHSRGSDSDLFFIEVCEETEYSLDEDELIQNHQEIILDTFRVAGDYVLPDEDVGLIFNECKSTPIFEFSIYAVYDDLRRWSTGSLDTAQFLRQLILIDE